MRKRKRVGIFGGSFDPIHTGHVLIANLAVQQFRLDTVVFIPARHSPHKPGRVYAPARNRLAMVKIAIKDHPRYTWDDIELQREGLSFTVDTLNDLKSAYPNATFYLLVGSDNIRSFKSWKDPKRIMSMARILVYRRWEHDVTASVMSRWKARLLNGPEIFISSTAIRERRASGRSIRHFVPPGVERYIIRHSLYLRSKRGS